MARWLLRKKKANIKKMSEVLNLNEILCQILVNRDINTKSAVKKYINPDFKYLNDTSKMKGIQKAIELLNYSIDNNEKIAIYGDYDVDGTMSTSILYKGIKEFGADVIYYIPDREEEGYGLNIKAIDILKELDIDLLITCDNGIAALKEIKYAKLKGIKTIIIDHHEPTYIKIDEEIIENLPEADALINPKQRTCEYKFKYMCAAGLSYKFIASFYNYRGKKLRNHDELLVLSMIATFCDIVDLKDENRIIVKNGLEILNRNKNINLGLKYLIKEKNYYDKQIDEFVIGYIIGPCINAAGRLEHASIAVELFISDKEDRVRELAKMLVKLNEDRKEMTTRAVEIIMDNLCENNDNVIVVYNDNIHESIAGIVAGRIKDRLYKPTIILTKSGDLVKGSGRSIEGYNLFEALSNCVDLFEKFGGHEMAAGLSIKQENIELLKERLNSQFYLKKEDLIETLKIDKEMIFSDITYDLAKELEILKPFGKNNKEPLFGSKNIRVCSLKILEKKNTIIFTFKILDSYRYIKGISFGKVEQFKEIIKNSFDIYDYEKILKGLIRDIELNMDLIYYININSYSYNKIEIQLKIIDFRVSKSNNKEKIK